MPTLKVHDEPDCGNAPRKEILRDLALALAVPDADAVASLVRDDVTWTVAGGAQRTGVDAVRAWVAARPASASVTYESLITHGRDASVSGHTVDGGGRVEHFCHMVRFAGTAKTAPAVAVTSYLIHE